MLVIARHENGVCFEKPNYLGIQNILNVGIPSYLITCSKEHLENGRSLVICTCPFFDGHLGVASSEREAVVQTMKTLESVFAKLIKANTFLVYLKDKEFQVAKSLKGFSSFQIKCFYNKLYTPRIP